MANKRISENKVVVSNAAAVPARRKSASTKRIARPASVESFHTVVSASEVPVAARAIPAESFQNAVARLAYSYWEARGCQGGSPEADWLRAEFELRAR
jgi:hypothetical protein